MYTFADLFAGIGGFRLGLEKAGVKYAFSSEINDFARQVYIENFGSEPFGDIYDLNEEKLKRYIGVDIIAAGFPCQPFSISGRQEGFNDVNRGNLFFEIIRVAKVVKPKVLFLENVAHLVNHDKGNTFKVIMKTLKEEGYTVYHKVLDASDFGLAQHRKRIFIIAFNKEVPFSFPEGNTNKVNIKSIIEDSEFDYLSDSEYALIDSPKVSPNGMKFVGYLNKNIRKGVSPEKLHLSRVHRQINRIYSYEYLHPTLVSSEKSGRYYILDNKGVRKLSIIECFRLQGFPDDFKKNVSLSQLYQQIGNSVPVPVIYYIGKEIVKILKCYY